MYALRAALTSQLVNGKSPNIEAELTGAGAAEREPEIRAALETQVSDGGTPNIKAALKAITADKPSLTSDGFPSPGPAVGRPGLSIAELVAGS